MKKHIILLISILIMCFVAGGCSQKKDDAAATAADVQAEPKEFKTDVSSITLTSDFSEIEQDKYTFQYSSPESICIGQRELKSDVAAAGVTVSSLSDYAGVVTGNVGIQTTYTEYGQSLYFEWDKNVNDTYYSYLGFVSETDDAYWLVQFAALKESYSAFREEFFKYYDSFNK